MSIKLFLFQAISVNIQETFMFLQLTRCVTHPLRAEGLLRVTHAGTDFPGGLPPSLGRSSKTCNGSLVLPAS